MPAAALVHPSDDPHFGPQWAKRLRQDIPGAVGLELLPRTGHLLMEEQPERVAELVLAFLAAALQPQWPVVSRRTPMQDLPDELAPFIGYQPTLLFSVLLVFHVFAGMTCVVRVLVLLLAGSSAAAILS